MTTLYEFGNNTNDSIPFYSVCNQWTPGPTSCGGSQGAATYSSYNGLGIDWGVNYVCEGIDSRILREFDLPLMSLYSDLEFLFEFTIYSQSNNTYEPSLFTRNIDCFTMLANPQSSNIVETNISSLISIPYTNINGDSILSLEIPITFLTDSLHININYMKISADTSTLKINNSIKFIKTNIYPNPSNNLLNIELNNPNNFPYELTIYDNLGRKVHGSNFIIDEKIEVDVRDFKKGIYHYTLFCPTKNLRSTGKFIKN